MAIKKSVGPSWGRLNTPTADYYDVFIPFDVEDRETYIEHCYRTGTVAVIHSEGGAHFNCPVSMEVMQYIYFPENKEDIGSLVVGTTLPKVGSLIITSVIPRPDESQLGEENTFQFNKETEDNSSSLTLNPNTNETSLVNQSVSGGTTKVSALDSEEKAQLLLQSTGAILSASNTFESESEDRHTVRVESETEDELSSETVSTRESVTTTLKDGEEEKYSLTANQESFSIKHEKAGTIQPIDSLQLGDGSDFAVLGNVLVDIMEQAFDQISKSLAGPYPIDAATVAKMTELKTKAKDILSDYIKLQ